MAKVSAITAYTVMILNLGIGLGGYLIFTQLVDSDVLKSIERLDNDKLTIWAEMANVAIMIVMICSFPLLCFCFRITAYGIMFGENNNPRYRVQVILVLTVCFIFGLIASFIDDIGQVLDLASAVAGIPLVLVFPGFLRYRYRSQQLQIDIEDIDEAHPERNSLIKQMKMQKFDRIFAFGVGVSGIVITLMGVVFSVWGFINPIEPK